MFIMQVGVVEASAAVQVVWVAAELQFQEVRQVQV